MTLLEKQKKEALSYFRKKLPYSLKGLNKIYEEFDGKYYNLTLNYKDMFIHCQGDINSDYLYSYELEDGRITSNITIKIKDIIENNEIEKLDEIIDLSKKIIELKGKK